MSEVLTGSHEDSASRGFLSDDLGQVSPLLAWNLPGRGEKGGFLLPYLQNVNLSPCLKARYETGFLLCTPHSTPSGSVPRLLISAHGCQWNLAPMSTLLTDPLSLLTQGQPSKESGKRLRIPLLQGGGGTLRSAGIRGGG